MKNKVTINKSVIWLFFQVGPQLYPDRTKIRAGAAGVRSVSAEEREEREGALGAGWGTIDRAQSNASNAGSEGLDHGVCGWIWTIYGRAKISQKYVRKRPIKSKNSPY